MAITHVSYSFAAAAGVAGLALLDVGGAGSLKFYGDSMPANVGIAISTQTLVATCGLSNPAFGAAADANPGAIFTAGLISSDLVADASDTVTFVRWLSGAGTELIQGDAGETTQSAVMNEADVIAGGTVSVSAATFKVLEGGT